MNRIVVTDSTLSELGQLQSPMELCSHDGQTLGYVVPAATRQKALYDWARKEFTDEEIRRAKSEPGGKTTEEVLRELRP